MHMLPYFKILRPHQWLKNLMLFFPPLLAGKFLLFSVSQCVYPFVVFSLASSATYVFNDIIDYRADLLHPKKCYRPLPAGIISITWAILIVATLITLSLTTSVLVVPEVTGWVVAYLALSLTYTLLLKHLFLIDLITIASFFLIRLMAGGAVFNIHVSNWLFMSVFLLALLLSAGKRLSELMVLTARAGEHRRVLRAYSPALLRAVLYVTAFAVLSTYAMYCAHHLNLFYSLPLCCYGLFRYIDRVKHGYDGDPTAALIKDPHLVIVGLGWLVLVVFGLYG